MDSYDITEHINNDPDIILGANETNDLFDSINEPYGNPVVLNIHNPSRYKSIPVHGSKSGEELKSQHRVLRDKPIKSEFSIESEPVDNIDTNLTKGDMLVLIRSEVDRTGIAGHHLSSLDEMYTSGIKQIACEVFTIEGRVKNIRKETPEDQDITDISYSFNFTDVKIPLPNTVKYKSGSPEMLLPNLARNKNTSYVSPLYLSIAGGMTAVHKNGTTESKNTSISDFRSGAVPIAVGSNKCHTYNCSKETLKEFEEDPSDPGGYFIINGSEWTIDNLENLTNNTYHVYKNSHLNEIARGTFLSKPGDAFENSYYMTLRYLNNGAITIELVMGKNEKFEIPFYIIFRALGMTCDRDIVNHIVYGIDNKDPVTLHMMKVLERAFNVEDSKFAPINNSLNSTEIINFIAKKINDVSNNPNINNDDNIIKYLNLNVLHAFDYKLLPHIGSKPDHRIRKLRFLGHLINKLLRVDHGVLDGTDRDSYRNKRVHSAGVSLAKAFKTNFNFAVVQEIKKRIIKTIKSTTFSGINLADTITGAIGTDDLERTLTQAITTGNKTITIKRNEIINRVSSQQLYHKNDLNVKSTLNVINTPNTSSSKQNERADDMRRVHNTYLGYIDISQSADSGEKVGMTKQKACTCSISTASSSTNLKVILLSDSDILPLDSVAPEMITSEKLAKVFVNGDWIGCCRQSHLLTSKYRNLRRYGKIHYQTSIVWEPLVREIYFWTDVGRLLRPIMIVYNNLEEFKEYYKSQSDKIKSANIKKLRAQMKGEKFDEKTPLDNAPEFKQWIKLKKHHIEDLLAGKITMDTLREQRIVEYISPEEQENTFIAPNIDTLREHVNDITHMYTHCDIDQAIMGLVTLASPLANHSSTARITMYTNHRKQSAGWFALNWPFRIDKNTTLQYYGENPVVTCFGDSLNNPNGHNCIVALMLYEGQNQEDSITLNRSSVDAGMFNASCFNNEKAKLEKNEQFGNPDFMHTKGIRRGATYEHIENGFIREGTIATKGTILIVKSAKINKPTDQYLYEDRSIEYKLDEPVYIEKVITPRNDEDALIAKVKMRAVRPLGIGDKLCLTSDHDVLTMRGWVPIAEVTLDDSVAILDGTRLVYEKPQQLHKYKHNDNMYYINSNHINQFVTLNHRMYVSCEGNASWKLEQAGSIEGEKRYYKKSAEWMNPDVKYFSINYRLISFNEWLKFLGLYYKYGALTHDEICLIMPTINADVQKLCDDLKISTTINHNEIYCYNKDIYNEITMDIYNKNYLPDYVWNLSKNQAAILLKTLLCDEFVANKSFTNDISRLAIHSGYTVDIKELPESGLYEINLSYNNICIVNENKKEDFVVHYTGNVYCLTVRTGVFMVKRKNKFSWTGNSSKTGNKGIVAAIRDRCDMPYTEDGLIPDIIVNSHSIPTRMAVNQIIECVLAQEAVESGHLVDATSFREIDIMGALERLKGYGIEYGGHKRMYNGMTGEWLDAMIFIGPTTYQRLQKFVIDEHYSVRRGPTLPLTRQPLDGKAKMGGLRIGEMEKDVLAAHGCMRLLDEKFYKNSDGAPIYICRICHNRAIVNEKEGIYKCKYCEDDADIGQVSSSWVANLFFNRASAMNVGLKFDLQPYEYLLNEKDL
jgi:DNA-directed RNA polymerase beta subunit